MAFGTNSCPLGAEADACGSGCCGDSKNCHYVARAGGPSNKQSAEPPDPNFDPWVAGPANRDTE